MVADSLRCRLASDDRLGRLAATGVPGASDAICERFREPLARYCRALVGDPEDAQEATQAALERAVRTLGRGDAPHALRPWLYRVAHNAAMDLVRRRRPHAPLDEVGDDFLAGVGSTLDRDELAEVLGDLRALPERQRGALLLRELAGLSYGELATTLGTTPQAARQSVFEARAGMVAAQDGRSASCEAVRRTLSDGDRRRLRSRTMSAHLDGCGGCRDFARRIRARRRVLGLLPVPWAATLAASAAGVGTGASGVALGGWGAVKATTAIAAAVTAAAGSVATVERLAAPPAPDRTPVARAERAPAPATRAAEPPAVARAASATSAPTPRRAVARRPAAARVLAARAQDTAAPTPRADLRRERAALRRAARRRREAAAQQAPAPALQQTVTTVTTSVDEARRQAAEDARRRTEQALVDARTRTREAITQAQTQTRQALEAAAQTTRTTLDAARTAVEESLSHFFPRTASQDEG